MHRVSCPILYHLLMSLPPTVSKTLDIIKLAPFLMPPGVRKVLEVLT